METYKKEKGLRRSGVDDLSYKSFTKAIQKTDPEFSIFAGMVYMIQDLILKTDLEKINYYLTKVEEYLVNLKILRGKVEDVESSQDILNLAEDESLINDTSKIILVNGIERITKYLEMLKKSQSLILKISGKMFNNVGFAKEFYNSIFSSKKFRGLECLQEENINIFIAPYLNLGDPESVCYMFKLRYGEEELILYIRDIDISQGRLVLFMPHEGFMEGFKYYWTSNRVDLLEHFQGIKGLKNIFCINANKFDDSSIWYYKAFRDNCLKIELDTDIDDVTLVLSEILQRL